MAFLYCLSFNIIDRPQCIVIHTILKDYWISLCFIYLHAFKRPHDYFQMPIIEQEKGRWEETLFCLYGYWMTPYSNKYLARKYKVSLHWVSLAFQALCSINTKVAVVHNWYNFEYIQSMFVCMRLSDAMCISKTIYALCNTTLDQKFRTEEYIWMI